MRKHETTNENALLMSRAALYEMLDCSRATGDAIAKAAGAERRIGRRVMIYRPAIITFLENGQEVK